MSQNAAYRRLSRPPVAGRRDNVMTILDYWRVLRRGWVFVVAGLVLGVGAAFVANVVLARQYTSDLTIYVSGQASGDYAVAASQLAQDRILSYRELVTEDRVLED